MDTYLVHNSDFNTRKCMNYNFFNFNCNAMYVQKYGYLGNLNRNLNNFGNDFSNSIRFSTICLANERQYTEIINIFEFLYTKIAKDAQKLNVNS